jgi:hypothetical protein
MLTHPSLPVDLDQRATCRVHGMWHRPGTGEQGVLADHAAAAVCDMASTAVEQQHQSWVFGSLQLVEHCW